MGGFVGSIKRYIAAPRKLILTFGSHGFLNWLPDRLYLKLVYWGEIGKIPNLESPATYNEKLQWLKLHDRKPEYSTYVDKYAVRDHVKKVIGGQYLVPLLGVYNSVEEIPWDSLPAKFVLKCTHGSGSNIICTDKDKLDIHAAKMKLNKWMKKSWYWLGREWPYKNIRPRIICEKYLSETGGAPHDYKVLCFDGKAKLIEVHMNRDTDHKQDFYDRNWNKVGILQGTPMSNIVLDKPQVFAQMLQFSEMLAQDKCHVRVDWYVVKNRLYFGEITFFDGSGLVPFDKEEDDLMIGSWINLKSDTGYLIG